MLYFILWYLTAQLIGLAALPLTMRLFPNLPDRGYAFARPLGLLIMAVGLWVGASFGILRHERVTLVVLLLIMAGVSLYLWLKAPMTEFFRHNRRVIWVTEGLFLGGLALASILRAYSPEIATAGGEKYMEYAFINAILRADSFPPPDPWLSGYAISYYYLGYIILALMIKLSGVAAASGFNLSLALLYAMTLTGAFSLLYNLTPRTPTTDRRRPTADDRPPTTDDRPPTADDQPGITDHPSRIIPHPSPLTNHQSSVFNLQSPSGSIGFGLLGAVFVAVLGNLMGFLEVLHASGIGSPDFWKWLDIKNISGPAVNIGGTPNRFIWWWQASRVINDGGNEIIDEFPAFSFLLGDNHPHVLALPFVLLAIALAVNTLRTRPGQPLHSPLGREFWTARLVPALILGALGFLNSWDFPTYTTVYVGAYGIQSWLTQGRRGWVWLQDVLLTGLAVGIVGLALYLPFWIGLQSQARGLGLHGPIKTRFPQFFVMFGTFIVIAVSFLGAQVGRIRAERPGRASLIPLLYIAAVGGPSILIMVIRGWWTAAFLTLVIGLAVGSLLLIARTASATGPPATSDERATVSRVGQPAAVARFQNPTLHTLFVLFLFALAFGLTLGTEFVFIRDNFGSRMNSVFKFYFQAWILLALACAYASWWLLGRERLVGAARTLQLTYSGVLTLFVTLGMIYPILANISRADNFVRPATLDGTLWVAQQRPDDYAAIQWLNATVQGQPVILEAPGDQGKSYAYEGRVSAFTGLPTVLGWGGHQSQWRGNYDEPGRREPLITQIYQTTDTRQAQQLLEQFNVEYVVYGSIERERYGPLRAANASKFGRFMDEVFRQGETVIYRRR